MARVELGKPVSQPRPKSDWIIIPDIIPVIIPTEQFERVQKLSKNNKKALNTVTVSSPANIKPLFHHKMFCGSCGRGLERIRLGGGYVYRCSTRRVADDMGCMKGSIKEGTIKDVVLSILQRQIALASSAKLFQKANEKTTTPIIEKLVCEIQNLRRLIEKIKITKMTLWENYHSGSISRESYQNENGKLDEQATSYEAKSAELTEQVQKLQSEIGIEDTFIERFSGLAGIYELTQDIVDEFVKAIYIYAPDRIVISFNYSDHYAKELARARKGV